MEVRIYCKGLSDSMAGLYLYNTLQYVGHALYGQFGEFAIRNSDVLYDVRDRVRIYLSIGRPGHSNPSLRLPCDLHILPEQIWPLRRLERPVDVYIYISWSQWKNDMGEYARPFALLLGAWIGEIILGGETDCIRELLGDDTPQEPGEIPVREVELSEEDVDPLDEPTDQGGWFTGGYITAERFSIAWLRDYVARSLSLYERLSGRVFKSFGVLRFTAQGPRYKWPEPRWIHVPNWRRVADQLGDSTEFEMEVRKALASLFPIPEGGQIHFWCYSIYQLGRGERGYLPPEPRSEYIYFLDKLHHDVLRDEKLWWER